MSSKEDSENAMNNKVDNENTMKSKRSKKGTLDEHNMKGKILNTSITFILKAALL